MDMLVASTPFVDRRDAGRQLAARLGHLRGSEPLVVALPRGGVEVGYEVSRALGAPLEVLVARKLGAPGQPELAIGALAPGGVSVLDPRAVQLLRIAAREVQEARTRELAEMYRRERVYRGGRPAIPAAGRTVVLVDDGIATGMTTRAALESLRRQRARRIVLAAPVCSAPAAAELRADGAEVDCVLTPEDLRAVGLWYRDFQQTSDEEVVGLLALRAEEIAAERPAPAGVARPVRIPAAGVMLDADLAIPAAARGLAVFAHGSGSSRHSARNRFVAGRLNAAGFATLLLDLLTAREESIDVRTREFRFDMERLGARLAEAAVWARERPETAALPIGLFGASTGAGAAMLAAASRPDLVRAIVSRGGRPDLAGPEALAAVRAPSLLIVGGRDEVVERLNRQTLEALGAREKRIEIVPDATHLFEEPGALERVSGLARDWFVRWLPGGEV